MREGQTEKRFSSSGATSESVAAQKLAIARELFPPKRYLLPVSSRRALKFVFFCRLSTKEKKLLPLKGAKESARRSLSPFAAKQC
mgnify:CR=1 FL=1